jgi:hypothetical protein
MQAVMETVQLVAVSVLAVGVFDLQLLSMEPDVLPNRPRKVVEKEPLAGKVTVLWQELEQTQRMEGRGILEQL